MDKRLNVALLQKYRARLGRRLVLKVVVFDDEDLDFARRCRKILFDVPFYLSSGTPMKEETDGYVSVREAVCRGYKVLAEKVCADPLLHDAVVLPQLHVLLWGRDLGR
jgi:7-carboxy-7-deazaguanine synthase